MRSNQYSLDSALGQRINHLEKMIGDVDVIVSSETGVRQNIKKVIRAKLKGKKVVREINEWPLSVIWKESKIKQWIEVHILPKFFDGFICISDVLVEFCKKHGRRGIPIFKLPMTVDYDEVNRVAMECGEMYPIGDYVCYAGGLSEEKDGVETLKVACRGFNLKILNGMAHEDVIRIMSRARCLVLARPDSLQARAGFPTKLGEYLALGRPVVVTTVGEIPRYLKDGESAYLVAPGDVNLLTEKISEVFADPIRAERIGRTGKEVALQNFDYKVHVEKLREWIRSI